MTRRRQSLRPAKSKEAEELQKYRNEASKPAWLILIECLLLPLIAGAACTVSQLSLSPIYGTIPASTWHMLPEIHVALITLSVGLFYVWPAATPSILEKCLPLHAWASPALLHYVLAPLSTSLGPSYGPLITELVVLFPLICLIYYIVMIKSAAVTSDDSVLRRTTPLVLLWAGPVTIYSSQLFSILHQAIISSGQHGNVLVTRWALQTLLAVVLTLIYPSRQLIAVVPIAFFQIYLNPHAPFAHTTTRLNSTLQNTVNFTLLDRMESTTGYLSVLESNTDQFRVLRCDHSLLGGDWLPTPQRRKEGITVAEPIYPVFTMLEAVRLVDVITPRMPKKYDKDIDTALVVGLGIGTAPAALSKLGVKTTVLELDPGVRTLARRWFDLPGNVSVQTADALAWVKAVERRPQKPEYDYIIHDVFTGGAEPLALFERSFLMSLMKLLAGDGAMAVNYAGDLKDDHTLSVLNTIFDLFLDDCRLFRESEAPAIDQAGPDFTNLVVFCRSSRTADDPAGSWKFKEMKEEDYLGSVSRRHSLPPRHEVDFPALKQRWQAAGGANRSVRVDQRRSAEDHWRIMRHVLPAKVWELY